jgi:hypothetical protein
MGYTSDLLWCQDSACPVAAAHAQRHPSAAPGAARSPSHGLNKSCGNAATYKPVTAPEKRPGQWEGDSCTPHLKEGKVVGQAP